MFVICSHIFGDPASPHGRRAQGHTRSSQRYRPFRGICARFAPAARHPRACCIRTRHRGDACCVHDAPVTRQLCTCFAPICLSAASRSAGEAGWRSGRPSPGHGASARCSSPGRRQCRRGGGAGDARWRATSRPCARPAPRCRSGRGRSGRFAAGPESSGRG